MKNIRLSLLLATLCVISWSFIPVVARLGQRDLDHFQLLFWSNALSTVVVSIPMLLRRERFSMPFSQLWRAAGLGGLGCFLYYALLYYGYAHENTVPVLVTQYSWPVLIVLLSVPLLGERLSWSRLIALGLGFLAIAITITGGDFSRLAVRSPLAIFLVLVAAGCFALFSVLSKRMAFDAMRGTFWFFLFATGFSLLLSMATSGLRIPGRATLIPVLVNGALINGLSYVLWIRALSIGEASRIAPLVFLAPVLAVFWVTLFFNEPFLPVYALGLGLCVASGLLCLVEPRSRA